MKPVDQLIDLFGGIRPMQKKLGEKHHTVIQGWQVQGRVPSFRRHQIEGAARQHKIRLPAKLISALFPSQAEAA